MNPIVGWIDQLRRRPRLLRALFFGALGLIVLFDAFASRHSFHFAGDKIVGFWALFALFGALLMGRGMKGLGHLWLMKPPTYYDEAED